MLPKKNRVLLSLIRTEACCQHAEIYIGKLSSMGGLLAGAGGAFILELQISEMPRQVHSELYINTTSLSQA